MIEKKLQDDTINKNLLKFYRHNEKKNYFYLINYLIISESQKSLSYLSIGFKILIQEKNYCRYTYSYVYQ